MNLPDLVLVALLVLCACQPPENEGGPGTVASSDTLETGRPASVEDLIATLGDLHILDARIPAPAAGNRAALYVTIRNTGTAPDTLFGIDVEGGAEGSIHRSVIKDGLARMEPAGSQPILPGETLVFAPGGLHGMLANLDPVPRAADSLIVSLMFRLSGVVELSVPVVTYAQIQAGAGTPHP